MPKINLEKISKECKKYISKELLKALPEYSENSSLKKLLKAETVNIKNLQLHDIGKRKKRDAFFSSLIDNINCQDAADKLKKILSTCQISEDYIDEIKTELKSLPLMSQDVKIQCWAVIKCALDEGYKILDAIDHNIELYDKSKKPFTLNNRNILSQDGELFSPDSAINKIVNFLTLTIKMLSYEHKLSKSGEIIVPEHVDVEKSIISSADRVFYYSLLWSELIICAESCILFDNETTILKKENPPDVLKENSVEIKVIFDRTIDKFERYDTISNERFSRRIGQNYLEAIVNYNIDDWVPKYVTNWSGDLEKSIIPEEIPFLVSLMEAIASHDKEQEILGLSLREWVRGYSVITYLAREFRHKVIYRKGELISILRLAGFKERKSEEFIKYITFGDDSRDIYDSPLIKTSNSSFFLYTPAYISPLISTIILSKLSSKQADLTKKGYGFERDIVNILNKNKLENRSFKFKSNGDEFEYDVIFLLNDKAFILECKNTNLSWGSVERAYQKKVLIDETTNQLKRLVHGLISHPEVFKEKFGKDISNYELIPVIMNNLPFSIPGKINGVYVTDSSAFGRLIKSRYINSGIIHHQHGAKVIDKKPTYTMWEGDVLTASDIINHFNSPVQLQDFLKYQKTKKYYEKINERKVFFNVVAETDYDTMSAEQSDHFVNKKV